MWDAKSIPKINLKGDDCFPFIYFNLSLFLIDVKFRYFLINFVWS